MKGKIPKMLEWVNIEADYYVWLDYAIEIKTNNFYEIIQDLEDYDICLFKHKQRNSIQEELEFIESGLEKEDKYITSRYSNENMNGQVRNYLEDSSFIDNKLFEMGFFIYSKNLIKNRDYNLMTDWFLHNAFYSVQDQLSFPYLLFSSPCLNREHLGLTDSSKQVQQCKPYPEHLERSSQVVKEFKERDAHVKQEGR
jgi:hypothetical protein